MSTAKAAKPRPSTTPPASVSGVPAASAKHATVPPSKPDNGEGANAGGAAAGLLIARPPAALEPDQQTDAERDGEMREQILDIHRDTLGQASEPDDRNEISSDAADREENRSPARTGKPEHRCLIICSATALYSAPRRRPAPIPFDDNAHCRVPIRRRVSKEEHHDTRDQRYRPRFRSRDHARQDSFPRLARQFLGRAVLASEGFHPGLHHRARLHGAHQAGIRQARRQDHRAFGRSGRPPCRLGQGHQGDAGLRAELSDDRRHRFQRLEALRHAARRDLRRSDQAHRRPTTRPSAMCSSSARTRRSSWCWSIR